MSIMVSTLFLAPSTVARINRYSINICPLTVNLVKYMGLEVRDMWIKILPYPVGCILRLSLKAILSSLFFLLTNKKWIQKTSISKNQTCFQELRLSHENC